MQYSFVCRRSLGNSKVSLGVGGGLIRAGELVGGWGLEQSSRAAC